MLGEGAGGGGEGAGGGEGREQVLKYKFTNEMSNYVRLHKMKCSISQYRLWT